MEVNFFKKSILIVDDNRTNLILLKSLLQDEGYTETLTAISAFEAYEILENNAIDLIILDIIMPEINGLEACESIKESKLFNHIPWNVPYKLDNY